MYPAQGERGGHEDATDAGATGGDPSFLVNKASFEQLFLQCQVCYDKFDSSERKPKTLQCGHAFCLPCIQQIFDQTEPYDSVQKSMKCPTCRNLVDLTEQKINELPNDFRVIQMMDFYNQASAESINTCSKHRNQELSFFCKTCSVPICRDCTVVVHRDSSKHDVVDVKDILDERRTHLEATAQSSKDIMKTIVDRSHSLVNASKNLKKLGNLLKQELDYKFAEYHSVLQKRHETLKTLIEVIITDKRLKIKDKHNLICEEFRLFQNFYRVFTQTMNSNNDTRRLLAITEEMQIQTAQLQFAVGNDDNELFQSCQFSIDHDNCLIFMSELGEVIVKEDQGIQDDPGTKVQDEQNDKAHDFLNCIDGDFQYHCDDDFPYHCDDDFPYHCDDDVGNIDELSIDKLVLMFDDI